MRFCTSFDPSHWTGFGQKGPQSVHDIDFEAFNVDNGQVRALDIQCRCAVGCGTDADLCIPTFQVAGFMLEPPSALVGSRRQAGRPGLARRDHRHSMQGDRALKEENPAFVSIWGRSAGFGSKLPTLQPCAVTHTEW